MSDSDKSSEGSDLLWGCAAIAKAIGRTERQAYHMLEAGQLPANRVGRRWVGSRTRLLRAVIGDDEQATT